MITKHWAKKGFITGDKITREVCIDTEWIDPAISQAVIIHSPDGFAWGYWGSGPSQLALAIALRLCDNPEDAVSIYQELKKEFIGEAKREWNLEIPIWKVKDWILQSLDK